jgi:hypothetical protein
MPTATRSPANRTKDDPSRYAGHGWLLSAGFTWNGELATPVYNRRLSGVMTQIERCPSGWLLHAFKYVDRLHRDATVPGLSLFFPGLTQAARAIEMAGPPR